MHSRDEVTGILPSVRDKVYTVTLATGTSGEDIVMEDSAGASGSQPGTYLYSTSFGQIAEINYAIVNKGLAAFPVYKFNTLKSYFPHLKYTREFITGENYLGNIRIDIRSRYERPTIAVMNTSVGIVLGKIAERLSAIEESYEGTKAFTARKIHEVFSDKTVNYTDPHDGDVGKSQNDASVAMSQRIDLTREDWFAFNDNYGTSEEKAFVAYFKDYAERLKALYSKIYLVRNERQFHIYSFEAGERFEPDYVLFLQKDKEDGYEQLQIFIEPKGSHLIASDQWKEDFLLQMKDNAVAKTVFVDDNEYLIWGFHFFNTEMRSAEFSADMEELIQA